MATQQIRMPVLRPHQVEHYNKILEILQRFYFYIDGSEPGTGKTHVASAVALSLGLPVIVVCPSVAKITWMEAFRDYGLPYWNVQNTGAIITYDTFRSIKRSQPKHGLLLRDDSTESPMFFPTPALAHIVRQGCLFIFDEAQQVKNNNVAHKAITALVRFIYTGGGQESTRSRAAFLSGTLLDKQEQAVDFMRMVGFIEHRNLYTKIAGNVQLQGIEELQTWARRISPGPAEEFIRNNRFEGNRTAAINYAFQLFRRVIRPQIMSIMRKTIQTDATTGRPVANLNIKNGFYVMNEADAARYEEAINELAGAVRFNARTGQVDQQAGSIGAVTTALTHIQRSKINLIVRIIRDDLAQTYPGPDGTPCYNKIILFADYYDVIDAVKIGLAPFNVLELTGRINDKEKPGIISRFNEDNDNWRVLIANPIVGGRSVNLQDMTGRRRRKMYIMPGYRINELHQASLRTYRDGTQGEAFVRFVYGLTRQGNTEQSILNALARKGKVMHQVLEEQRAKFPGEYENEYEVDPRTLFGDDFFERNRSLAPVSNQSDDESDDESLNGDDLAVELEDLNLDRPESPRQAPQPGPALPNDWRGSLPMVGL